MVATHIKEGASPSRVSKMIKIKFKAENITKYIGIFETEEINIPERNLIPKKGFEFKVKFSDWNNPQNDKSRN